MAYTGASGDEWLGTGALGPTVVSINRVVAVTVGADFGGTYVQRLYRLAKVPQHARSQLDLDGGGGRDEKQVK